MTIEVRTLSHRYPRGGWVLREMTMQARPGRITAIIGPNASGKSTLLRCIIGAIKPSRGSVRLHGSNVHRMRPSRVAQAIAYVPQRSVVSADFTVRQIVELGRYALAPDNAKVNAALRRLELEDLADRKYHELSVGQQQRVTLARAVAQLAPDGHLIADEPTSAMDLRHVHDTMVLLRELADGGATVLVAMHDLTAAAACADDVWLLDEGRLKVAGTVSDVMDVAQLEVVFNAMFERVQLRSGRSVLVSIAPDTGQDTTMQSEQTPVGPGVVNEPADDPMEEDSGVDLPAMNDADDESQRMD